MRFDSLIPILEKQIKLYTSLYHLAVQKVEVIKKNDISSLNQMMTDEQKHITAITALENERIKELQKLFPSGEKTPTMRECIELADSAQKPVLENIFEQLTDILQKTKEKNNLNQELIRQSLHFVNYSLSLFKPNASSMNYGPNTGNGTESPIGTRSLFNSQA